MTKLTHLLTTIGFGAAAIAVAAVAGCNQAPPKPATDKATQVERGRLLVSIGGCADCHTPMKFDADVGLPVPDMSQAAARG
jgi:mono/diheme cytochrome c family protein